MFAEVFSTDTMIPMNFRRFVLPLFYLLATSPLVAQKETPEISPAESSAFRAITEAMSKTRQGEDKPTEADFKTRREAGMEMVTKAREFLKDYPASKNAEDAPTQFELKPKISFPARSPTLLESRWKSASRRSTEEKST